MGLLAKVNKIRFSTKPKEDNLVKVLYEYRIYDPENGRFGSKDPIEEWGSINLYGFLYNDPINVLDLLGLLSCDELRAMIARQNANLQNALNDANMAQSQLSSIEKYKSAQTILSGLSLSLSLGAVAFAGTPIVGAITGGRIVFTGFGTSPLLVGGGTVSLSMPISSIGSQPIPIATGIAQAASGAALLSKPVSGMRVVGGIGSAIFGAKRFEDAINDAQDVLQSASAAYESALSALQQALAEFRKCGCH